VSELATLQIKVDASGAIRVVDQFGKTVDGATKKANSLNDAAKRVGFTVGTTMVAGLALAIKETADAQREQAQLAAAIRSTGGAAGQTLDSLNGHAEALRRVTAATGGQIAETQALLLTFTKIGAETFPAATLAALDMAQALGTDAKGAAMQLGKALNDPILGVTALGRAGVQFNDTQKAQIKAFVETNQLAKAQGIILAELQTQVGGSAAAYRNTLGGALAAVRESFLELFEITSPGMKGLVESLNLLADMIAMIPTRLEQAKTGMLSFLNRAGIALLEFNQRGRPSAMLDNMRGRQTQLDTDASGLAALAAEQYKAAIDAFIARANAGAGGTLGGTAGGTVIAPGAVADYEAAVKGVLDAFYSDAAEAFAFRMDRDQEIREAAAQYLPLLEGYNTEAITLDRIVVGMSKGVDEMSEAVRVFREQTQIALARFASDFLKDGFKSIGRFWEDFKQLGRDAIGNIFAKEFMEGIGGKLADKLSGAVGGALGKIGGLGAGVLGPLGAIAGITAGVFSMFGKTSKWEEAAEAQNKAARAQLAAAESLRMTVAQQRAAFLDDFLNYANTETDQQREVRSLANRRNELQQQAFDIAKLAGGALGNNTMQRLNAGMFDKDTIAAIRRDAESFNQTEAARQSLRDFADALEDLNEAFERNTKAAELAAKAQSILTLEQFRDSLTLSAQSPLSPTAQLAEARRQYEAIIALAQGGDQSAIASLPETARTLLEASRAVNASGARYAQDFARVQADTADIIATLQRPNPDDLELVRTDPWYNDQLETTRASLTVQQVGFQAVVDELVNVREELEVMRTTLRLSIDDMAAAL
jgi:hypothetical protein